jgi:hypothetical protein
VTRHRLVTLGRPGTAWTRAVARWATTGLLSAEVRTCLTADELRQVATEPAASAALVEAGQPGVDRVLADAVRRSGAALFVVQSPSAPTADRLQADAELTVGFDHHQLVAALETHVRASVRATRATNPDRPEPEPEGTVVAVTGPGGTGASTVAQALAARLAPEQPTLLADLALDSDQHVRHGVPAGAPGVFELAEALRHRPTAAVQPIALNQEDGYDLLCGLRRRREWTVLARPTVEDLIDQLRAEYQIVVADISVDADGHAECGSHDVEDRNALTRATLARGTVVAVVGRWSTTGVHRLVRTIVDLRDHGVEPGRVVPVVNGAGRTAAVRSGAVRTVQRLLSAASEEPWPSPICLPHDPRVEPRLRECQPLPRRFVARTSPLAEAVLERTGP